MDIVGSPVTGPDLLEGRSISRSKDSWYRQFRINDRYMRQGFNLHHEDIRVYGAVGDFNDELVTAWCIDPEILVSLAVEEGNGAVKPI
jgi:hypothetical protein